VRIAIFEPDIPQNAGAIMRLAACFDISVDIIEPCGFIFSDRQLKRSGMDYIEHVNMKSHTSWDTFYDCQRTGEKSRIILLTTKGDVIHTKFKYKPNDILLLGRESSGVPDTVHKLADARIIIPMTPKSRSLNVANAAAIVLGEALRQTDSYPK